jgi:hypothetical protein
MLNRLNLNKFENPKKKSYRKKKAEIDDCLPITLGLNSEHHWVILRSLTSSKWFLEQPTRHAPSSKASRSCPRAWGDWSSWFVLSGFHAISLDDFIL